MVIGVVYGQGAQRSIDEMLGNRTGSDAFSAFLDILGRDLELHANGDEELKRFAGFAGQSADEPAHVYRTQHRGLELVFHVSTLLPCSETDAQQVARKRKIGNDVVTLIFSESSQPLEPHLSASKVNHVYCVVRPDGPTTDDGTTRYSIGVSAKSAVPQFGPALAQVAVSDFRAFRELLLTKLINANTTALNHGTWRLSRSTGLKLAPLRAPAPGFKKQSTTLALLEDLVVRFSVNAKWQSWSKTNKRKQRAVLVSQDNANQGICAVCKKPVTGESGVSAAGKIYHQEHFCCTHCRKPFGTSAFVIHPTEQARTPHFHRSIIDGTTNQYGHVCVSLL